MLSQRHGLAGPDEMTFGGVRPAGLRVPEVLQLQVPHRRVHHSRRLFSRRDGGVLAPEGSPAGDGAHRLHRHERPALCRVRDVRDVMQHHHRRPRVPGVQAGHAGRRPHYVCFFTWLAVCFSMLFTYKEWRDVDYHVPGSGAYEFVPGVTSGSSRSSYLPQASSSSYA